MPVRGPGHEIPASRSIRITDLNLGTYHGYGRARPYLLNLGTEAPTAVLNLVGLGTWQKIELQFRVPVVVPAGTGTLRKKKDSQQQLAADAPGGPWSRRRRAARVTPRARGAVPRRPSRVRTQEEGGDIGP